MTMMIRLLKKPVKTIKKKPVTPPAAAPQATPAQSASAPH